MSRSRLQGKARLAYDVSHTMQLRTGHAFLYGRGFGEMRDSLGNENLAVIQDMRRAWPELRDVVMDTHRQHAGLFTRAWAWWVFDRKMSEPPRDLVEQKKMLIENGWLTEEEKRALG